MRKREIDAGAIRARRLAYTRALSLFFPSTFALLE
jgi:hypothetical protein